MRFAYVGTFLGIPVALAFLYMGWRIWSGAPALRIAFPAVVGAFIALAGLVVTNGSPYLDGPRNQMTVQLSQNRVSGINTVPRNATHIDLIVTFIDQHTSPGDPVLVFPDGQLYYQVTGRTNPTKIDWYNRYAITSAISNQAVADLQRNPPKWVLVQDYNESDFLQKTPLDFEDATAWKPVYDYITSHYDLVATIDGVRVYRLR